MNTIKAVFESLSSDNIFDLQFTLRKYQKKLMDIADTDSIFEKNTEVLFLLLSFLNENSKNLDQCFTYLEKCLLKIKGEIE